jgi:hypothetical protein
MGQIGWQSEAQDINFTIEKHIFWKNYTTSTGGIVTKFYAYIWDSGAPSGQFQCAIYNDGGGLLVKSQIFSASESSTWEWVASDPIGNVHLNASSSYSLCITASENPDVYEVGSYLIAGTTWENFCANEFTWPATLNKDVGQNNEGLMMYALYNDDAINDMTLTGNMTW